jgi:integrase/recombinase XerD
MARGDIEAFIESLQDRGLKPNSVRTRLCAVYAFVRFLIEKKAVGHELLERRIKLKLPDRLPRAIDPGDLKQLLSVIDNIRDRALLLHLLRTGMRIGELLHTKVHDVDLNNHRILIYQAEKTGVGRVVYYSEDAKEALLSWLRVRNTFKENLFYGQGHRPLCYEAARSMFNKYLEKAGLLYSGYGNRKNGNRYLSWAFTEAAHLGRRYNERFRAYYNRKVAQANTSLGTKALSNKLARISASLFYQ